ncbi:MAG TPA: tetratricopeptide repeat protein [Thermoanaerobaculia bacterium]|jgi:tetratricopeptide (TPR) repeat protein
MSEKITRKDLKRNDLVETVGRTVDYVTSHRRGVGEGVAVAAGIALLVGGFFLVKTYREARAGRELSAGLAAFDAPLAGEPGGASAPLSFPSAAARDAAAAEHLRKAASYGGTTPARAASVILAARDAKATAADSFERAARDGRFEIAAAAEIDAARLLASQGKVTEAVERLKRAVESPDASMPKDALLFALAQIYEGSGASSDARSVYQRIVNDYPNSPYRADARQKLPNG